jgi:hypothetical protein
VTGDGSADVTLDVPGPSPRRAPLSWNIPGHRGHAHDERVPRVGASDAENARIARTVAEHATDAEDCRLLLDMLGLRLDGLRAERAPGS